MGVGKILFAKDWSQKTATKVIRKGNQFVRTKTVVTPLGRLTAKFNGDKLTVDGKPVEILDIRGDMSKKDAIKSLFEGFEKLFDPKAEKEMWAHLKDIFG